MVETRQLYEKKLEAIKSQHFDNVKQAIDELLPFLEQLMDPKAAGEMLVHDLSEIWKAETVRKFLPDRCKDEWAQEQGKKGGQPSHEKNKKKKAEEEPKKPTNYEKQIMEAQSAQVAVTADGSQQLVSPESAPADKKQNQIDALVEAKKYIATLEQENQILKESKASDSQAFSDPSKADYKKLAKQIIDGDKKLQTFEASVLRENNELKQEVDRLSEPFEHKDSISIQDRAIYIRITVTPAKRICRVELDTERQKKK